MSDFLTIANEMTGGKPKPSGFGAIASDFGVPTTTKARPAFEFDDAAEFRKKLVKAGDKELLAEFDSQYSTVAPPKAPKSPEQPPSGYEAGGMKTPSNPNGWKVIQNEKPETIGDKLIGAREAASNALSSVTFAPVAGTLSAANQIVRKFGYAAADIPETEDMKGPNWIQDAFNRGAEKFTDQPKTEAGKRYVEKVVQPTLQAAMAVAPLHQTAVAAQSLPAAGRAINDPLRAKLDRGMPAAEAAFQARRVEPSMGPTTPQAIEAATKQEFKPPTVKEASPAIQEAVKAAEAKGQLNHEVMQRHVEADTLPIPIKLTEGQATLDPVLISTEMNGRGKGKAAPVSPEFYKQQGQAVAQNMDAIRTKAAPDIPATASLVDHGQTLLDAYKAMDEPIRADITAKYKALADANGGDLPLSGQAFVAAADAALKKANRTRFVPAEVRGILDDIREGGPMTFGDFETYRTILAEQARKADRAGDGTASYAVGIVRDALESLPMEGEAAALKPLADAARQAAKARFDAIKADPAYKASMSDSVGIGEPSPLADKFFNAYVTKGARSNVAQMRERLAGNPLATQTIAAGTLDQLRNQLKADPATGKFSQDGYNKGLKAIEPKLDSLLDAETAHQAKALGNVAKTIQTDVRGAYVNSSNSATALVAEGAKASAEHGTNMLFGGLPVGTVVRKAGGLASDAIGANKATKKATAPGAGLTKPGDFPGVKSE